MALYLSVTHTSAIFTAAEVKQCSNPVYYQASQTETVTEKQLQNPAAVSTL